MGETCSRLDPERTLHTALPILLLGALLAGPGAAAPTGRAVPAAPPAGRAPPVSPSVRARPTTDTLLRGPARCALRFLEAVRLSGPRAAELRAAGGRGEEPYRRAVELVAPRARAEIARRAARGEEHPLAPWRTAARGAVLETFQLLAVRAAPGGAAVVSVRERWWGAGDDTLTALDSEYLVGRVGGDWRVIDRRPGAPFRDEEIAAGYAGWFDAPAAAGAH